MCQLIAVVSRMGKSEYSKECTAFLLQTTDDNLRVGFDMDLALRKYASAARLTTACWQGKQVVKAAQVLRLVQNSLVSEIKTESRITPVRPCPSAIYTHEKLPFLPSIEKLMSDSIQKMSILSSIHLRFV